MDKIVAVMVMGNTVLLFLSLQYHGQVANRHLGLDSNSWESGEKSLEMVLHMFSAAFLVELVLRVYVEGLNFFKNGLNVVDAVVVPISAVEVIFEHTVQLSFVRTFRVLRIISAFRMVRTFSHCESLRVLLRTIAGSIGALIYSMSIMLVFILVFALFLAQMLHGFIIDESKDLSTRLWVNQFYGDGAKTLWTVFQFTFSGGWPNYARPLVEEVHWIYAPVFALYVAVVIFSMTKIIGALFLKETLAQASADAEIVVSDRARATRKLEKNVLALFQTADLNDNGVLTKEEFIQILSNEKIRLWLGMLGVNCTDPQKLYETMAGEGTGGIACDGFLYGIKRLKGEARAQDLIPVVNDCKRILRLCEQTMHSCSKLEGKLDGAQPPVLARDDGFNL